MQIILASNSKYKKQQLTTLGLSFLTSSPNVTEIHDQEMSAESLSIKLAQQKAEAVLKENPDALVIGSDQTAITARTKTFLNKPGSAENAIKQLTQCSGQIAYFFSGVCLMSRTRFESWSIKTTVKFRELNTEEIRRYISFDQPLDCAGSFKVESLGISLFEQIESNDPTALVGLPLISIASRLRQFDYQLP